MRPRLNLLASVFAVLVLMVFSVSTVLAATNRMITLEATAAAFPPEASGHIVLKVEEWPSPSPWENVGISFHLDVSKLDCRASFLLERSYEFYVLYVNDQRLASFDTVCGWGPGVRSFQSIIIYTITPTNNPLEGWLDDPVNDDVHAVIQIENHLNAPGVGTVVLEGWLEE